jgi:hypothetical protein
MSEAALFIGWGQVVRGREKKAVEVFNESVAYWGQLQQDGKIERFDLALLNPHGGDLSGFALVRGTEDQIDTLRRSDDFQKNATEADQIVENYGIVDAAVDEGIADGMAIYQEAIASL